MLKIINDLVPFFEDCYRRINVREYAKIIGISPPTASGLLNNYKNEGLLLMEKYKNYILFYANKDSKQFIGLSKLYWACKIRELVEFIAKKTTTPTIVLFGSLSKAESKINSDIDIAIFAIKRELDLNHFEKKLKRKIQIFWFQSINTIKNKELANNIINGYVLNGTLRL